MNRGFIIIAENNSSTDYVKAAAILASSIHETMPNEKVSLLTNTNTKYNKYFDSVILFPYGSQDSSEWKLANDWQTYEASPYEYTIKLEADMIIPRDISYWWDILQHHDFVVSTNVRNYKQEIVSNLPYRQFIIQNNLPDTYNAITYFKKSDTAKTFFEIVRSVFENWNEYKNILKCNQDELVTTDWAYAIASHIIGVEKSTLPTFTDFSMIHMKQAVNDTITEKWTDHFVYEFDNAFRIQTVPQLYPFHYYVKAFTDILAKRYL